MFKEFKKFIVRGNMIDLAVGMIIGSAFTALVKSLVDDIFMPVLSLVTGKVDFTNLFIALDGQEYATLEAAKEAGASCVAYGQFISGILNFIIMAFVVFMFVKVVNKLRDAGKKPEAPAAPATKVCPYCKSTIAIDATRCSSCTSQLEIEAVVAE